MKVARIFSDNNGESHFDDIEVAFIETDFIEGAQAFGVTEPWLAERVSIAKLPIGWSDPQHPTPARQIVVFLSGVMEVTASDGETGGFRKGDILMLEDVSGTGHGTIIVGESDSLCLLVRLA